PINTDDRLVQKAQLQVLEILEDFPQELTIHDFRIVGGEKHMNLVFDMVVPYDFVEKDEKNLVEEVKKAIKKRHPNYDAIITVDRQYSLLK
ncbi:MAG TPA: cation transporter, partial [Clostridiaceae bacterium]|nr:cation transporter [Clostridiaceae bacterium]